MEFSVLVPVYNVEKYLTKCLVSLERQTFKDFEVILVDDGSKDNSGKICDKFCEENSNMKVIHKKNEGLISARRLHWKCHLGIIVCFVILMISLKKMHWKNCTMLFQVRIQT